MPYTLKPNKMFVKDPEGDGYLPQNVITDKTTDELVKEITATGTTQINAVQEKGTEVLESIPDTYEDLQNEVTELKNDLENIEGIVPYYGAPETLSINETYAAQRVGVKRSGAIIELSGRSANQDDTSSSLVAIKLTNSLKRIATVSGYQAFDKDLLLQGGHIYTISFKLLSGSFSLLSSGTQDYISLMIFNESNNHMWDSPYQIHQGERIITDIITINDDTSVSLFLYISKGIEFAENTKFWIQLQDVTEALEQNGLFNYLNNKTIITVPEGTQWN